MIVLISCGNQQGSTADETITAREFEASDFKWPELIESLNNGTLDNDVGTDESIFILYYIKELNDIFADTITQAFIGPDCYTDVYNAEMDAKLKTMFFLTILPKALKEMGAAAFGGEGSMQALSARYPIMKGYLEDISEQAGDDKLKRLAMLYQLPKILSNKAKQDAITLITKYQCSNDVTKSVYKNAYSYVNSNVAILNKE